MATDVKLGSREYSEPLVVFAMNREAAPFLQLVKRSRLPVRVVVSGVGRHAAARTTQAAQTGQRLPPRLVVSAGFCGALSPSLRVGDVVVATSILDWSGMTVGGGESIEGLRSGRLLTVDRVIGEPSEKRQLHEDYGADVVDMESAAISEASIPWAGKFLAVRAVSDAADTALSPELVRLLSGGNVSPWKAVRALVRKPALLREFVRLARDTKLASRNLATELLKIVAPPAA